MSPNRTEIFRGSKLRLWGWINQGWAPIPTLSWFGVHPEDTLKKDLSTVVYSEPGFLEAPFGERGQETGRGKEPGGLTTKPAAGGELSPAGNWGRLHGGMPKVTPAEG